MANKITDKDWQEIEDLRKEEKSEAEWITQIRNYCRDNEILPTHLIDIHKEWAIREQKYNQTFKTEKAPE